jgi:hypothetical protein
MKLLVTVSQRRSVEVIPGVMEIPHIALASHSGSVMAQPDALEAQPDALEAQPEVLEARTEALEAQPDASRLH